MMPFVNQAASLIDEYVEKIAFEPVFFIYIFANSLGSLISER